MNFERLQEDVPHMLTQLRGNAALLEQQLGDGRDFRARRRPGLGRHRLLFPDLDGAHVRAACRSAVRCERRTCVAWETRVRAIGHGRRTDIDAQRGTRNCASCDAAHRRRSG